ncbi:hypothetical protein G4B88_026329 [Cannabis sativa]|uniref:Uncharacterized protein n=1 Tax=Cannabis sativa TaxID=3483 RepID=A0A7J6DJE0_CANSA|nr:hypothetical protein G4B88_026329 [Cannabis sativa]
MKSNGIQQKVTYNRRSQPVGKGAIRYSTYSGALALNGWVPIDLPNWHNVDEVKLDMIWKEMKAIFDLDDCVRHQTLSNIGNNCRGFKSRLTNNFIMKYMNDPIYRAKNPHTLMYPPAIYLGITKPVWHNSVASRTTPEFQELTKLQQARRAENDNPHRLGRKGYPNLEYELQQQYNTEEKIERAVLLKEARKDKKAEYAKESDKEIASTIALMKALEEKSHGHQEQEHVEHDIEDKSDYPNFVQDESFIDVIVKTNEGTWSQLALENLVDKQVAKAIIRQAAEVHNKPLNENSYRIEVNELLIPDALIPKAIDPDEIYLVKHVFRSYVAWPQHLAVLEGAIQGRTPDYRASDLAKRLGEIIPGQQLMATLNNG